LDLTTHISLSPIRLCKLQKGCTRFAAASDKIYQLLAHGWWFSPGTPASSTNITGRHDIAEILLKVALKHQKSNQSKINILNVNI
jgi:5-methylcytosine-specific restriction endonuclease McrBC regulatory subunit McrC